MSTFRFVLLLPLLIAAASCGGSYSSPSPATTPTAPTTPSSNTIGIPAGARALGTSGYSPNPITVPVGTTVTWTNNDREGHTSTSNTGVFDSGTIPAGGSFKFTFVAAGTYAYHCSFHPGMIGSVVVQ